jgi:tetratricopeptide (TPR) repeat protein
LIGVAQQRLGRAELALNQFDRAIAAEANFVEAWINRGNVLAALARRSHAIESFSRAIALQPENVAGAQRARHGADDRRPGP